MYAYDTSYDSGTSSGASYGGAPGKSTLTSRLDGGAAGTAPAGTPPAPAELLALAGLPISDGGFMYVLEPDGSFLIIATPEGEEALAGGKLAPTAPSWAGLSERMLAAGAGGAPRDPISDAMERYRCGMIIAMLMLTDPLALPKLIELRDRVESLYRVNPADHGTLAADLATKEAAHLRAMFAEPTMTAEQIAWAHRIIPLQPAAAQGNFYEQLQSKSPYANERDNEAIGRDGKPMEKPDGGTCNLTSLSMCLQYLAVPKPTDVAPPTGVDAATLQYEDALFYLWRKLGSPSGNIIGPDAWIPICTALGVTGTQTWGFAGKKAAWETTIRDGHLRAGHAVMAGGWGHVVRIQDVTEAGVIVDDPFGGSTRPAASWPDGTNSRDGGAGSDAGNDCDWPWPKDQTIPLPYYFTVSRG